MKVGVARWLLVYSRGLSPFAKGEFNEHVSESVGVQFVDVVEV